MSYLLWLLGGFGVLGLRRFYLGRWVTGLIWLLTGGLLGIGAIIDLVVIPPMVRVENLSRHLLSQANRPYSQWSPALIRIRHLVLVSAGTFRGRGHTNMARARGHPGAGSGQRQKQPRSPIVVYEPAMEGRSSGRAQDWPRGQLGAHKSLRAAR